MPPSPTPANWITSHWWLLFVGTGQTALAGTPTLSKLLGRFPVQVSLSDTDVEGVIREALQKDRQFFGIEASEHYFQVAIERLGGSAKSRTK